MENISYCDPESFQQRMIPGAWQVLGTAECFQLEEVLEVMEAGITSPPKDDHNVVSKTHNMLGYMAWGNYICR